MDRVVQVGEALERLAKAAATMGRPVRFMEVCGTHTMAAFRSGLHSLLPGNVTLLSGPGCPVCVTAQGDIDLLIELAGAKDVTICTYGDMMRVPGAAGSLEKARSEGADVKVIYSTLDAVAWAKKLPARQVVLGAVGFETTAPATAAAVLEARRAGVKNFSALTSHKRVVPAMLALLADEGGDAGSECASSDHAQRGPCPTGHATRGIAIDGFLCPGHVSVVVGWEVYRPIVTQYQMPCVIAGFEEPHMALALAVICEMVAVGKAELANAYPEAVSPLGNMTAQKLLEQVFESGDVRWRALGTIAGSGMILRAEFAEFDAMKRFGLKTPEDREIPGCICGKVICGKATPAECGLFGNGCSPVHPIGPCMVSSEGTCAAWFKYGRTKAQRHKGTEAQRVPMGGRV